MMDRAHAEWIARTAVALVLLAAVLVLARQ